MKKVFIALMALFMLAGTTTSVAGAHYTPEENCTCLGGSW